MLPPTHPLANLPDDISHALRRAGWRPGVNRRRRRWYDGLSEMRNRWRPHSCRKSPRGWVSSSLEEFPLATTILDELRGIRIMPVCDGEFYGTNVEFDPSVVKNYEQEVIKIGEWLQVQLYPLGMVDNSIAILLVADSGHLFMLGYAGRGVRLAGDTFAEGLSGILKGQRARQVFFKNDVDGEFREPSDDISDPMAFWPPEGGLVSHQ